jgi:hypothetical protein
MASRHHKQSSKSMHNLMIKTRTPEPLLNLGQIELVPSHLGFITPNYDTTTRVSQYIQAYGKQNPLRVQALSAKASPGGIDKNANGLFRLRLIQNTVSRRNTPLPMSKIHTRPISHLSEDFLRNTQLSKKSIENLRIKADKIKHDIYLSKSDKLDLMRDLATYECYMGKKIKIAHSLAKIHSMSHSVPNINEELTQITQEVSNIRQVLRQGLGKMHDLEQEYAERMKQVRSEYENEIVEVRSYSKPYTFSHLLTCVRRLSGIYSIIKICGDQPLENFHLDVQLASGHAFSTLVKIDLMGSGLDSSSVVSKIKEKLLPKLFLTLTQEQLMLHWDQSYGQDFITMIIELKGSPLYVNMLVIRLEDESVHLSISSPLSSLRIPRGYITESGKIFELPSKILNKLLTTHLRYNIHEHSLEWLSDSSQIFQSREKNSPLMDSEFIINSCGMSLFQPSCSEIIKIGAEEVQVEILSFKEMYKLRIIYNDSAFELSYDSPDLKILEELQFRDIRKNPVTFLRSIELVRWIRNNCMKRMREGSLKL